MTETQNQSSENNGFMFWFGITGAAIAWFTHLNLTYILVGVVCNFGGEIFLYLSSIVLGLIALASGFVSWSTWKEMSPEEHGSLIGNMEGTRRGFMVYGGMIASGLFFFAIVMATIPILFLNPCFPTPRI